MILSFLKWKGCFQHLAGKSSDKTVSCHQSNNMYGSQHPQNSLQWHLFSRNGSVCSRCVFRQLWNSQETCFWRWESGPYDKSCIFHLGKLDNYSLPEKHTRSLFSLLQQLWSSFCIFWKKNRLLVISCWESYDIPFHLIRAATCMAINIQEH